MKVKKLEFNNLYNTVEIYDDVTGEKLGEWVEIPAEQLN